MRVVVLDGGGDATHAGLAARLEAVGCEVVGQLSCPSALPPILASADVDMIVADLAQPTSQLLEQVGEVSQRHGCPVAVFVEQTSAADIQVAVRAGIASYVVRGSHDDRLRDALEVARARFAEEQGLRSELSEARSSLADRKIIERAKGTLMRDAGMDEDEAYEALRKLAMRRNTRLIDVALAVLAQEPSC